MFTITITITYKINVYLLSSLIKSVTLLMSPGPAKFTGVTLTL